MPEEGVWYRGVVVETNGPDGVLFCKDFPNNPKMFTLKDRHLELGNAVDIQFIMRRDGTIEDWKSYKRTSTYTFEDNSIATTISAVIKPAPDECFPFTQIGYSDDFGNVLIPEAWFNHEETVILKIHYNDMFVDGIYWIATEHSGGKNIPLKSFDRDLKLPNQTLFPKATNLRSENGHPRTNPGQRRNYAQNDPYSRNGSECSGRDSTSARDLNAPSYCILSFPHVNIDAMKTKPRDNKEEEEKAGSKTYMLILQKYDRYAVGLVYPNPNCYGIVTETCSGYEENVKPGAYVDAHLRKIIDGGGPFKYFAGPVYPQDINMTCKIQESKTSPGHFIFAGQIYSKELNDNDISSIDLSEGHKVVKSVWGDILFDGDRLRMLAAMREKLFTIAVLHANAEQFKWYATKLTVAQPSANTPSSSSAANTHHSSNYNRGNFGM